jgi:DNA polymerase (family 10)
LEEIEDAATGRVPNLVELGDLQGTFHCHTTYSDGKASLEDMAAGARSRGWSYLGIADHSRSAGYAGGLQIDQVLRQQEEIDLLNVAFSASSDPPFQLFKGIESDILADGNLDYPAEILRSFDYVVGSVHSGFRMDGGEMTRRVIRAVENPALTILGHPTGRMLLRRSGYSIDIDAVLRAAASAGVIVEINAHPNRLDLDWRNVRTAAKMGILIAVNPDAHSVRALDHVEFGVNMARKAGLEARQILNCWTLDEVKEYFGKRKEVR